MTNYHKALQNEMKKAEESAKYPLSLSREEIEAAIQEITDWLRGPMANSERIILCAERREFQTRLKNWSDQ